MSQTVRAEIVRRRPGTGLGARSGGRRAGRPAGRVRRRTMQTGLRGRQRRPWSRKPGLDRPPGWGADRDMCAACRAPGPPADPDQGRRHRARTARRPGSRLHTTAPAQPCRGRRPAPALARPGGCLEHRRGVGQPARGSAAGRARSATAGGRRVLRDPFCSARAKNIGPRRPAAHRAARARPWTCWLASQLRSARRSTAPVDLSRPRWPKALEIGAVGAYGVLGGHAEIAGAARSRRGLRRTTATRRWSRPTVGQRAVISRRHADDHG